MTRVIPPSWLPDAPGLRGIVNHWTAGNYHASELDREDYHLIIEGDGRLVRGYHTIPDNLSTSDGDYAAHCGRHNTGYIGVSVACMANATEVPFYAGKYPMTRKQWDTMMAVNADLVERYGIPITPKTLCGHGAIYGHFGEPNTKGKWDPLKLPWDTGRIKASTDGLIRLTTAELVQQGPGAGIAKPADLPVLVSLNGVVISDDAYISKSLTWVPIRLLSEPLGFSIVDTDGRFVLISHADQPHKLDFQIRGNVGYTPIKQLRELLGNFTTEWDPASRTVKVVLK